MPHLARMKPCWTASGNASYVFLVRMFTGLALKRSEQRCWAPLYLQGLLGPGARKSVEPMAERICPGQTQQLHHFVSTSPWSTAPLEQVLRKRGTPWWAARTPC